MSLKAGEAMVRKADLRDEIEAIGGKQRRVAFSYLSVLVILAIAMIQGTFVAPAAVLTVLILVPLKKALRRYRALELKKAELLEDLRTLQRFEG